ncbi:MAG: SUMF1/EgtB/PvdO family nonheme iron enzyme [Deltaproteobacteria bacterium]|nr:SUMF1/EgtB/PvdO family nonheme iron enzyme [Deltaproteobacteria bacterium]
MKTLVLGFSLAFALVSSGCHLFLTDAGGEGQACFDNKTCNAGLVCSTDLKCIPALGDGGSVMDVGEPRSDVGETDGASAPDAADSGTDASSDGDTGPGPVISSIDGTGHEMGVSPRPEDEAVWNAHAGDRAPGQHRLLIENTEIVVTGDKLAGVTLAQLEGQSGQGTHQMAIKEVGMNILRLGWPATLLAGGMFVLSVSGASGDASAQVYFLQGLDGNDGAKGDKGDQGVQGVQGVKGDKGDQGIQGLPGDSFFTCVGDDCSTTKNLSVPNLAITTSYSLPDCPQGYLKDARTDIVLCKRGSDEMVKVGNFWIDRYEASVWEKADCLGTAYGNYGGPSPSDDYPSTFPDTGNWTVPLFACSKAGVVPSRMLTWFQAQQSCELSGKDLCSNEQWQASVAGTNDPGSYDGTAGGACNTSAAGPRKTGMAGATPGGSTSCISKWGAEDMIGNVDGWAAAWVTDGPVWNGVDGESMQPWPVGYGEDKTYGVNGRARYDGTNFANGLPGATKRGGSFACGIWAGAFTIANYAGPSDFQGDVGFRCCRGR